MTVPTSTYYDICMHTPIGVRKGHMTVQCCLDSVSGHLDILKHRKPFAGTIDSDGNCKIAGQIITLMRTINYVATGKISSDSLSLSLIDGRHVLKITGTACCP